MENEPKPRSRSLDGVRAMAIAMVVVFHSLRHAAGGYIGVEIFFTLSGFLITTLLLGELTANHAIDRRAFYARRALRLLPALGGAIALCVVLVAFTGSNNGGIPLTHTVPPVALYLGNWVEAAGVSLGFLSHTWSLAIEEQFYLLWPFVVVALARRTDAVSLLVKVTIGLVIFRAVLTPFVPSTLNFSVWTTSRADCLVIGAILAIVFAREPERVVRAAGRPWVGVAGLLTLAGVVRPALGGSLTLDVERLRRDDRRGGRDRGVDRAPGGAAGRVDRPRARVASGRGGRARLLRDLPVPLADRRGAERGRAPVLHAARVGVRPHGGGRPGVVVRDRTTGAAAQGSVHPHERGVVR